MRMETNDWFATLYVDTGDLEAIQAGNELCISEGKYSVLIAPNASSTVRLERTDDKTGRLLLSEEYLQEFLAGERRELTEFNGGLPLRLTVRVEPGVGAPDWWTGLVDR